MIKLPYTFLPQQAIALLSRMFLKMAKAMLPMFPSLGMDLRRLNIRERTEKYVAMCITATVLFFIFLSAVLGMMFVGFKVENPVLVALLISFVFSLFVFMQQVMYPKMLLRKRIRNIEQNLMPALQNMLVQLNSGVPMFNILTNIASGDYGDLSKEFDKAVREINAGKSQIDVLDDMASNNPSTLFRRAIWQIVSGMKSGANLGLVMVDITSSLNEQQMIQIQNYGSQLSPLAMFYMLAAVIVPSLSVTFIIILSSFISLSAGMVKLVFWGLLAFVIFIQIMFLGVIKSRRPNLLVK